jgi:hypothetical protein
MSIQTDTTTPPPEVDSIKVPKRAGRPKKYIEGAKQREKDTKYHQLYYHLTNKETTCDLCGKKLTTRSLLQHKKSMKCKYLCMSGAIQT